ncbi:DUF4249 domain-containing protein [Danxiaibacter flavus]|uniref:DUF4249 domain-containing protein n=1 Tax=Danxiaibacter flavus TaxID=3049108 RepID=A0ABV3ZE08_9BACT|nr:DUF4249 domain-containing protein [Chitinophagaceae bacterium DXS]
MKNKLSIFLVFFINWFCSCEKTIHLTVADQPAKLVVDGSIENGQQPLIFLSTSLNYFSTITPEELASSFVHDAVVTISDGIKTVRLKEFSYKDSVSGYTGYFYTTDPLLPSQAFRGKVNTTYSLQIQTPDSITYTASTTIPAIAKKCDSLWWLPAPAANDDTTLAVVMGRFTDPPGLGNYVRGYTRVNSEPFYPPANSVFDDQFTDGTTYDFQIVKGQRKGGSNTFNNDTDDFFHRGDTVTLRLSNIDKATYDFWRTWEFSYQSVGNPFASPTKVLSNISGNALGVFAGYGSQYKTIVIPK